MINTDCTDSYKSNYHTITTSTAPVELIYLHMYNIVTVKCEEAMYKLNSYTDSIYLRYYGAILPEVYITTSSACQLIRLLRLSRLQLGIDGYML